MRRRKLLVALAGLAVVVPAGVVVLLPRKDRITQENCDAIRFDMGRAEVEQILGGPPGDYRTVKTMDNELEPMVLLGDIDCQAFHARGWNDGTALSEGLSGRWFGNEGHILVYLSPEGGVGYRHFYRSLKDERPIDNLFWQAKRQWRRWFSD
jgi:hypothetical protein